jgi:AraC family transcriptional activator of pobA
MARLEHFKDRTPFPFSDSKLHSLSEQRSLRDLAVRNARAASPEPPAQESDALNIADTFAAAPHMQRRAPFRSDRIAPQEKELRLLPLAAFLWGSKAMPPRPRTRPDHALVWVTKGRMFLHFPGHSVQMHPGQLQYIPAGTAFATLPGPATGGHVALITRHLAEQAAPSLPRNGFFANVGPHGSQLLATLEDLHAEIEDPSSETTRCLMDLLSLRLRQLEPALPSADGPFEAVPRLDSSLIERFTDLVLARLGENWTIAGLAEELQVSTATLDQAALAAQNCRAIELAHRLRLESAFELLRTTRQSPAQIAARLGYASHAHFARACVAATGRSPEMFRAQFS